MIAAVSPYHLVTREPAAMAALLLAEHAVTLLPAPLDADGAVEGLTPRQTAHAVPSYREFLRSWDWTTPLWKAGVLRSRLSSGSVADELPAVQASIAGDERFAALRGFFDDTDVTPHDGASQTMLLSRIAGDLLRSGPDPSINIPVHEALDRFAARHGLVVVRGRAASIAQRAEESLARTIAEAAVPIFLQATARRLLHAREVLAAESALVRSSVHDPAAFRRACKAYAAAFTSRRDELRMGCADDEVRLIEGNAAVRVALLPAHAVLISSAEAMESLHAGAIGGNHRHARTTSLALPDDPAARDILTVTVRPLGQPRAPGRAR
jgi:hypothetical protein